VATTVETTDEVRSKGQQCQRQSQDRARKPVMDRSLQLGTACGLKRFFFDGQNSAQRSVVRIKARRGRRLHEGGKIDAVTFEMQRFDAAILWVELLACAIEHHHKGLAILHQQTAVFSGNGRGGFALRVEVYENAAQIPKPVPISDIDRR